MNSKIFISHSNEDIEIIKPFVELIESGIGIDSREIFCSSLNGQGIKLGVNFKDSIHKELNDATMVITIITDYFYASAFCMCELGGVWLKSKDFVPVLVPPLSSKDLEAVLSGIQAIYINSPNNLDQFRDEICNNFDIKPLPVSRWNQKKDEFLDKIRFSKIFDREPPIVPKEMYYDLANQLKKSESELSKYQGLSSHLSNIVEKKIDIASRCPSCNIPRQWMTWDVEENEVCQNPFCDQFEVGWG